MSWLFSQALVEEYLGDTFLDGEQSALSNGKPIQQAYCALGKMTDFCRVSQFGMMFKPLTENLGEELLMLYQEDFLAKTSQQQEGGGESRQNDQECGKKWRESLAKLDLDTLLWKIPQCSLLEDLEQSLEIWPKWGSMRNGECFPQPMLERTTKEREFGYWLTPTATAISGRSQEALDYRTKHRESQGHNTVQPGNLAEQVLYSGKIPCKDMKIPTWPTPVARMWKDNASPSEFKRHEIPLAAQVGGKLNPMWTEWLMGWLLGWTDLKPLEMDKFPFVQQQHGICLEKE
jgi:hypothetical protein